MYPPQTSFIAIQVALSRYLLEQGWQAVFTKYPYWYLGSTPYRYLTGPIIPYLLILGHRLLPGLNMFEIFFILTGIMFAFGILGVFLFIKDLVGKKDLALLTALIFSFGWFIPCLYFYSDGLSLISFSIVPYILLFYKNFLLKNNFKDALLSIITICFVILINISILPSLILGMIALFLAVTGWQHSEIRIKRSILLLIIASCLVTVWYSPSFWWQIIKAPSFAGKPLVSVINQLWQLGALSLAVALSFFSGKILKTGNLLKKLSFYWIFIFGFLTLIRFLSDPDFWMDWSSYWLELQFGMALLMAIFLEQKNIKTKVIFLTIIIIGWLWLTNKFVIAKIRPSIEDSIEYKIGSQILNIAKPNDVIFLSGSTVFWLNAFFDIPQVRGGADLASVNPLWRQASWEIREGENATESVKMLKQLGVNWLVVHLPQSREYFHDFKNPQKFENQKELVKVYESAGDRIYKVIE
jgi:hypothetical protein